jgi:hypothetical protein
MSRIFLRDKNRYLYVNVSDMKQCCHVKKKQNVRWLLNRGDRMCRFDCIFTIRYFLIYFIYNHLLSKHYPEVISYPIVLKFSPSKAESISVFIKYLHVIFFKLLFTSIYDLNTNLDSRRHNFLWLYTTCIKRSPFACPVIEHFIWIEPLLRGHLSYKVAFSLSQRWPLNTGLTVLLIREYRLVIFIVFVFYKNQAYHSRCYILISQTWILNLMDPGTFLFDILFFFNACKAVHIFHTCLLYMTDKVGTLWNVKRIC